MERSPRPQLVSSLSVAVVVSAVLLCARHRQPRQNAECPGAQPSAPTIDISGFVDFYYGYNFNTPATGQAQVRNFDVQHNSFSLNLAEVAFERKPTNESRGGFRVDLDYGPAAQMVHASEPGGPAVFQNILQAYVSYFAPIGSGLQFDFGKFATPMGNEVIKTRDNWNYSRSLLFTLAEPVLSRRPARDLRRERSRHAGRAPGQRLEQRHRQQRRQESSVFRRRSNRPRRSRLPRPTWADPSRLATTTIGDICPTRW